MSSGLLFKAWYNRTAVFAGVNGMWETVMQTLQKQRIKGTPSPPPALLNPMKRGFYIQRRNSECPVLFGHNMSSPFTSDIQLDPQCESFTAFLSSRIFSSVTGHSEPVFLPSRAEWQQVEESELELCRSQLVWSSVTWSGGDLVWPQPYL